MMYVIRTPHVMTHDEDLVLLVSIGLMCACRVRSWTGIYCCSKLRHEVPPNIKLLRQDSQVGTISHAL